MKILAKHHSKLHKLSIIFRNVKIFAAVKYSDPTILSFEILYNQLLKEQTASDIRRVVLSQFI